MPVQFGWRCPHLGCPKNRQSRSKRRRTVYPPAEMYLLFLMKKDTFHGGLKRRDAEWTQQRTFRWIHLPYLYAWPLMCHEFSNDLMSSACWTGTLLWSQSVIQHEHSPVFFHSSPHFTYNPLHLFICRRVGESSQQPPRYSLHSDMTTSTDVQQAIEGFHVPFDPQFIHSDDAL